MATEYPPPPTWADPIIVQTDPATGQNKASFNPVWMDWFIRLTAILSTATGSTGALGNVTGPASSVNGLLAVFNGTDGRTIADGGALPVFVDSETPTGVVDGANLVFTLANAPDPQESLILGYSDGAGVTAFYLHGVDYTLAADTITFTTAPAAGGTLKAFYRH